MIEIRKTDVFANWIDGLKDLRARASGNPGDAKSVGEGVSELRVNYGPGYRVYFKKKGRTVIFLLTGGDKRTQSRDIKTALRLARNLED